MAWQLRKVGKAIPFLPPYFFPSHYSSSGWFSLGNFTTIIELITLKKYPLLLKKLFFTSLCRLLLTRAYAYWLKRVAQNSKIGVMKANQSFCCGFCFEGSSRDELSTISDFLSDFRTKVYTACHSCVVDASKSVRLKQKTNWLVFLNFPRYFPPNQIHQIGQIARSFKTKTKPSRPQNIAALTIQKSKLSKFSQFG